MDLQLSVPSCCQRITDGWTPPQTRRSRVCGRSFNRPLSSGNRTVRKAARPLTLQNFILLSPFLAYEQIEMTPFRSCPQCNNESMVLKTKKDGGYMVSCLGFPACRAAVFFPSNVEKAEVSDEICQLVIYVFFFFKCQNNFNLIFVSV